MSVLKAAEADSALNIAKHGDTALWTPQLEMAAQIVDRLDVLLWQNAGSPRGRQPQRFPRPGDTPRTRTYGAGESWTTESLDAWIAAVEAEHADGQIDTVVT